MIQQKLAHSARVAFLTNQQGFISNKVESIDNASFSCVISMAHYICEQYPDLAPPQFPEHLKKQVINLMNQYITQQSTVDKKHAKWYLQPWCDYFNKLFDQKNTHGYLAQKQQTLYIICKVNSDYFEQFRKIVDKSQFKCQTKSYFQNLLQQIKYSVKKQNTLKIGVINFAASQLKADSFQPKINLLSLFTGIWYKQGDSWRRYDILKQNYPTQQQIMTTDVFILSGSTMSVNDNNPYHMKAMELLKNGLTKNKKLKLLGLCFGHQAIAKAFGGKVQKKDLYSGIQIVKFSQNHLNAFPFMQKIKKLNDQGLLIFQYHSDYVTQKPQSFHIISSSQSCENQAMISQDGRCLSFQFHSEYTDSYTRAFEIRVKMFTHQQVYPTSGYQLKNDAIKKYGMERHHESIRTLRRVVRDFIQFKI